MSPATASPSAASCTGGQPVGVCSTDAQRITKKRTPVTDQQRRAVLSERPAGRSATPCSLPAVPRAAARLVVLVVLVATCLATAGAPPARADDTTLAQSHDATLDLDLSDFKGFEGVRTSDTRVLASGVLRFRLRWQDLAGANAATLRVYTRNGATPALRGLRGMDVVTQSVHLKTWTANFGPGPPDIEDDEAWQGEGARWVYVLDRAEPAPVGSALFGAHLYRYTNLMRWHDQHPNANLRLPDVADIPSELTFALTFDKKAGPQRYRGEVFVEFALSDDHGATERPDAVTRSFIVEADVAGDQPTLSLAADRDTVGFAFDDVLGPPISSPDLVQLSAEALSLHEIDAATIRVLTRNGESGADTEEARVPAGLVGACDPSWTMPLKATAPNIGCGVDEAGKPIEPDEQGQCGPAPPGVARNWSDPVHGVWLPVHDAAHPVREDYWPAHNPEDPRYADPNGAWNHLLFDYTDLIRWSDAHDHFGLPHYLRLTDRRPNGGKDRRIRLGLATHALDALPQTYRAVVHAEAVLSDDLGETESLVAAQPITVTATVDVEQEPIDWLLGRVRMRPDMDGGGDVVERLADGVQDPGDASDAGWPYQQALAVIALTHFGLLEEARQVLAGLRYIQNEDGSYFFSYMTGVDAAQIEAWRSDRQTLYVPLAAMPAGQTHPCAPLPERIAQPNGFADELERRVCWAYTQGLDPAPHQLGPWLLADWSTNAGNPTGTLLPDKVKYRTYDFRKYAGQTAWVVMAVNYYESRTGDRSFADIAEGGLRWLGEQIVTDRSSPGYGGVKIGRLWQPAADGGLGTAPGAGTFTNPELVVAEHQFDFVSAAGVRARLARQAGKDEDAERLIAQAEASRRFLLRELWAPHIDRAEHPEVTVFDNFFYPGLHLEHPDHPDSWEHGYIDSTIYLDTTTWSVLSLGPDTPVDVVEALEDGTPRLVSGTLAAALDFPNKVDLRTGRPYLLNEDQSFFEHTCAPVEDVDGYQERVFGNPGDSGEEETELDEDDVLVDEHPRVARGYGGLDRGRSRSGPRSRTGEAPPRRHEARHPPRRRDPLREPCAAVGGSDLGVDGRLGHRRGGVVALQRGQSARESLQSSGNTGAVRFGESAGVHSHRQRALSATAPATTTTNKSTAARARLD